MLFLFFCSKIRKGLKINQFPGQWIWGRKDCFTREYRKSLGKYDFFPRSFVLPEDYEDLRDFMLQNEEIIVMIKPINWFSGLGIKITDTIGNKKFCVCIKVSILNIFR